jgi:hypothetical protein
VKNDPNPAYGTINMPLIDKEQETKMIAKYESGAWGHDNKLNYIFAAPIVLP